MTLEEWADRWNEAREDDRYNCSRVLDIWRINPRLYCRDARLWDQIVLGYRKKSKIFAGEKEYERALLNNGGLAHVIKSENNEFLKLDVKHHAFPLAKGRRGQTITDCMGVIHRRGEKHPIAIEIKVKANDPWYAVVENLQQVRLMRSNVCGLKRYFERGVRIADVKGAWGMVLAPDSYYKENKKSYDAACRLCNYMKENNRTNARIIIASIDWGIIKYKAGYWPK